MLFPICNSYFVVKVFWNSKYPHFSLNLIFFVFWNLSMNSKDSYFFSVGCDPLPFLFLFMFRLSLIWLAGGFRLLSWASPGSPTEIPALWGWLLCLFCCYCNLIPFTYIYMHNSLSCRCVAYSGGASLCPYLHSCLSFMGLLWLNWNVHEGKGKNLDF